MRTSYQLHLAKDLLRVGSYEKLAEERERKVALALKRKPKRKSKSAA